MKTYPYTFDTWPRTKAGEPFFTCSEQAIYFAHLCSNNEGQISQLTILRKEAYQTIAQHRGSHTPNYQTMMDLAVKAQFYRECLEEIKRINDSKYEL